MNYFYSENPLQSAAEAASGSIIGQLAQNKKILWLLTGGSGLTIAVRTLDILKKHDLSNLTVSLTDERYGIIGHNDENWQQLIEAGFDTSKINTYRPLIGEDIAITTAKFNDWIQKQLKENDFKIGLFGIGTDGHTAGIKPSSIAATSTDFASSFKGEDFERITITSRAILELDEAIIQASGSDKKQVIKSILTSEKDPILEPAQNLKKIKKATLFSDINKEDL